MSEIKYCISCEENVWVYEYSGHAVLDKSVIPFEVEWCNGPIANCPPPELEEDWQYNLQDPSPAELEEMNANTEELLLDFEG